MRRLRFLLLYVLLLAARVTQAQMLLWERSELWAGAVQQGYMEVLPIPGGRVVASGASGVSGTSSQNCPPNWRYVLQTWDLNGTLLQERLGPAINSDFSVGLVVSALAPAVAGGRATTWWTTARTGCAPGTTTVQGWGRLFPLTAGGDTLPGWTVPRPAGELTVRALLAHGKRILVAGRAYPLPLVGQQYVQYMLTCFDTTGTLLWQRTYPRPPRAFDLCSALVRVPTTGGYLLSGDGDKGDGTGLQHLFTEVDSLGNLRRQRLVYPLGPAFDGGYRNNTNCNLLVLPNHGGYLASGTADSTSTAGGAAGGPWAIPYLLKLDTALHVVWACRLHKGWAGAGVRSRYAYRVRPLPDGSVAVLVREGIITPDLHLVRVSPQGQLSGHYVLTSADYTAIEPWDWQWLGDGTLVVAGQARLPYDLTVRRAYLARWDLRATPLATTVPASARQVGVHAYPNPARDEVQLAAPGVGPGAELALHEASGRVVRRLALAADGRGTLPLAGLAAGVYVARVQGATGAGTCKIVVLP